MDPIEELRAQLREAQCLMEVSAQTYPERVLARLVANCIRREIEALESKVVDD